MVRLLPVRKLLVLICLLANLGLMLIPFDSTHAHVAADHGHTHAPDVHGGQSHDFDLFVDADDTDQVVVDLKPELTSQITFQSAFSSYGIPLACTVVLLLAVAQLCVRLIAPHRSDPRPLPRRGGHWRPPLRGPPAFSIQA